MLAILKLEYRKPVTNATTSRSSHGAKRCTEKPSVPDTKIWVA